MITSLKTVSNPPLRSSMREPHPFSQQIGYDLKIAPDTHRDRASDELALAVAFGEFPQPRKTLVPGCIQRIDDRPMAAREGANPLRLTTWAIHAQHRTPQGAAQAHRSIRSVGSHPVPLPDSVRLAKP